MSLATGDVPSSSGSTGRVRAMKLKKLIETTAVVTGTTLVIAFGSVPAVAGPTHDDHSQHRNVERALATYEAMQQYLYIDDGSSLYLERYPLASDDRTYSFEWPFSQAYIATLDLTGLPGRAGRQSGTISPTARQVRSATGTPTAGARVCPATTPTCAPRTATAATCSTTTTSGWLWPRSRSTSSPATMPNSRAPLRSSTSSCRAGTPTRATRPPAACSGRRHPGAPTATPSRRCPAPSSPRGCT